MRLWEAIDFSINSRRGENPGQSPGRFASRECSIRSLANVAQIRVRKSGRLDGEANPLALGQTRGFGGHEYTILKGSIDFLMKDLAGKIDYVVRLQ